jgi:hypothetical protein
LERPNDEGPEEREVVVGSNTDGGIKAARTNKERYGNDFYRRIGAKGGAAGRTGGFYGNRVLARKAGKVGGAVSRRGKAKSDESLEK